MALLQKGYLGATPLFRDVAWLEAFAPKFVDAPSATTVTASSTAHTKGGWSELISSTSGDSSLLHLIVSGIVTAATNTATLLDIGTGAAMAETVIAGNIAVGSAGSNLVIPIPIKIPSGTRVAARIQSVVTGGKTAVVSPTFVNAGDYATVQTLVDVIGGNTANSQGISFVNASGSWVEAIASTTQPYRAVVLVHSAHDTTITTFNSVMEVGVGAAGLESSFGSAQMRYINNEQAITQPIWFPVFGRAIPTGSRLAVRHNIAADPSKYGFCLIGIP